MKTHIATSFTFTKCYSSYSSFDELLPIESRSQHELWGWETLFQELNSFLRDADRHLGNATVNYAQYVVDRLEITVRTISQLKEHMEAEMTSIEERNRRSGMSMWQQIHLLDNGIYISLYLRLVSGQHRAHRQTFSTFRSTFGGYKHLCPHGAFPLVDKKSKREPHPLLTSRDLPLQ